MEVIDKEKGFVEKKAISPLFLLLKIQNNTRNCTRCDKNIQDCVKINKKPLCFLALTSIIRICMGKQLNWEVHI